MHEINDSTACNSSLQYQIDNLAEFRATAYQCGLQAMDKAQDRTMTPIYFSSNSFSGTSELPAGLASSQNYYKIKYSFNKL